MTSGEISSSLPLSRTTIFQHLNVLKESSWIIGNISGGQIKYCLNNQKINNDSVMLKDFLSMDKADIVRESIKEKILFICTGNSCRSQMAEALFNYYNNASGLLAVSAGVNPAKKIHPYAVEVMNELNISMNGYNPKSIDLFIHDNSVQLVLYACSKAEIDCPYLFPHSRRTYSKPFDDPTIKDGDKHLKLNEFRRIRDEIQIMILNLLKEIN